MTIATSRSVHFAAALTRKFAEEPATHRPTFFAEGGKRFDRIVVDRGHRANRSVFAFVERESGDLLKAAGWKKPAPHVRFSGEHLLTTAVEAADVYGSFLYMR